MSPPSSIETESSSTSTLTLSSPPSDPSEATKPQESLSTFEEPSTSTPSTANQTNGILYQDRIFATGDTGSGKSSLIKAIFLSTAAPRLIVDPADSSLTASCCGDSREDIAAATFHDPRRVPDVATARFVPRDSEDKDAYNELFRWVFAHFPRYVWIDEAGIVAPATGYPKAVNTFAVQGRKRRLGLASAHTRPREICKNLIAQAEHVFVFALASPEDRKYLAEKAEMPLSQFEQTLATLPEYGFAYWNKRAKRLIACPPLKV